MATTEDSMLRFGGSGKGVHIMCLVIKIQLIYIRVHYATFIHAKTNKDTNKFLNLQIILHFLEKNVEICAFFNEIGQKQG